jgi:hypothetical protein
MTTLDVLFGAVGLITAARAVLAVITQHLVHAALWLVVTSAPWPAAIWFWAPNWWPWCNCSSMSGQWSCSCSSHSC